MTPEDADFAVCCAVPVDAPGVTIVARPAGRPGEAAAKFSAKYGQSTGVVIFDDVFVPYERVFLAGETEEGGFLTTSYATHHRHSCIGARAGFGDLLIGAGALMIEANGLDPERHGHIRDAMVELIKIVEGFFACGVAASVYCAKDPAGSMMPDPVFANIGKLLLATQIYDMHRLAHYVSGGLVVALPGPDEDHNPETAASLSAVLAGRPDIPAAQRLEVAALDRGPHGLAPGRLVLADLAPRRRLAGGDEAGDLAQLPGRGEGRAGRAAARPRRARRRAARVEAARPLLRHGLRGAEPAGCRACRRGTCPQRRSRGGHMRAVSSETPAGAQDPFGYATHEVLNQPPPLADYDAFGTDPALKAIVRAFRRRTGPRTACPPAAAPSARRHVQELAREANRHGPELRTHDRFGHRVDRDRLPPRLARADGARHRPGNPFA